MLLDPAKHGSAIKLTFRSGADPRRSSDGRFSAQHRVEGLCGVGESHTKIRRARTDGELRDQRLTVAGLPRPDCSCAPEPTVEQRKTFAEQVGQPLVCAESQVVRRLGYVN
jgi:hypothetical protein